MNFKKDSVKKQIKKILEQKKSTLKKYFLFKSLEKLDENKYSNSKNRVPNESLENPNNDTLSENIYNRNCIDFSFSFDKDKFLKNLEKNKDNETFLYSDYKKNIFKFSCLKPKTESDKEKFEDWINKIKLHYNEFITEIPYSFELSTWNSKEKLSNIDVKEYAENQKEQAIKNLKEFQDKRTNDLEEEKKLSKEKTKWTISENLGVLVNDNIFKKNDEYEKVLKINDEDIKKIESITRNHDLITAYKEIKFKGFQHTIRVWYNEKDFELTRNGILRTVIIEHPKWPIIFSFVAIIVSFISIFT